MKHRLTRSYVNTLRLPKAGELLIWDTQLRGFFIKACPSYASYCAQTREKDTGKIRRHYIGRTNELSLEEARERAGKALHLIREGGDPEVVEAAQKKHRKVATLTLVQLYNEYISGRQLRPRTLDTYNAAMRLIPDWHNKRIKNFNRDEVEDRLQDIAKTPGVRGNRRTDRSTEARHLFLLLRALLNYAADKYGAPLIPITLNRLARGKSWATVQPRDSIIPEASLRDWFIATENIKSKEKRRDTDKDKPLEKDLILRDFLQFLMFSAIRPAEARQLLWSDVKFEAGHIVIRPENAKTHQQRLVPLTDLLEYVLLRRKAYRPSNNPYVFPTTKRSHRPQKHLHLLEARRGTRAVREAGIHWQLYDSRKTYGALASRLIPWGAVQQLMGHAGSSHSITLKHYARLDPTALRIEAQKVADFFRVAGGIDWPAQADMQGESNNGTNTGTQAVMKLVHT